MAIQKEIWTSYIAANLFKDNEFLNYAFNADQYVLEGKVVHIANAGSTATIVKNRTSLPATVIQRTDVDVTYSIDEFTTDPILIPNADTVELSYSKLDNVMSEYEAALRQLVADWMLYNWRAENSTSIVRTTGGNVTAHLPSATGTRKKFTLADVKSARLLLNKQNVPKDDRYLIIDSDMYDQLMDELNISTYRESSKELDLPKGVIGKIYGFYLMERTTVAVANNAGTPVIQTPGTAGAATDNGVALGWQKSCVERALGTVDFFENLGDPTYYGDIYSALIRMGGRKRRNDQKGIVAIIQQP
ncbi:MAG TPA: phage capsid protein [Chitinophagales bacterium]|nr:phage capsid protein [Chitinophagales bacterium]